MERWRQRGRHGTRRLECGDGRVSARYHPWGSGGSVAAYDLKTGRQLWHSPLKGIGAVEHSAYRNLVNMGLGPTAVSIQGHESYGDYLEILDRESGKRLAHRVFREGFEAPKRPN